MSESKRCQREEIVSMLQKSSIKTVYIYMYIYISIFLSTILHRLFNCVLFTAISFVIGTKLYVLLPDTSTKARQVDMEESEHDAKQRKTEAKTMQREPKEGTTPGWT